MRLDSHPLRHWQVWRNPHRNTRRPALTLVELVVVTGLITAAVGLAALRAASVSTAGRLRSAASQICSIARMSAIEARLAGAPRLLEFGQAGHLRVRAPRHAAGQWQWDEGREYAINRGVHAVRLLVAGRDAPSEPPALRIDSEGRFAAHGLLLAAGERFAALVVEPPAAPDLVISGTPLRADTLEQLHLEMESHRAPQDRTDVD